MSDAEKMEDDEQWLQMKDRIEYLEQDNGRLREALDEARAGLREEIDAHANYTAHLDELEQENVRLREENAQFKRWLKAEGHPSQREEVKG